MHLDVRPACAERVPGAETKIGGLRDARERRRGDNVSERDGGGGGARVDAI